MAPRERKRRREDDDDGVALSEEAERAYRTLREVFPTKSWRYLRDRAASWVGGRVEELVEQLLVSESRVEETGNESVVVLDDTADLEVQAGPSSDPDPAAEIADNSMYLAEDDQVAVEGSAGASTSSGGGYIENNYATLLAVFPDVSPIYLQEKAWNIGNDPGQLESFISNSLERKSSLPSRKEYEKGLNKRQAENKIRRMTAQEFLSEYQDPHQHFGDTTTPVSELYKSHALFYLAKHYPNMTVSEVKSNLDQHNGHFVPTIKKIEEMKKAKKGKNKIVQKAQKLPEKPKEMDPNFLKEYIYFKQEPKIRKFEANEERKRSKAVEDARKVGGLVECQVCFDSDCLVGEVAMCEAGCMFCRECVRRGAGVQIGDNKATISCLLGCGEDFPLPVLQMVLPNQMYSKLLQRLQIEEVKAAGLEDLVQCPACNYATIMPDPEVKVITCGNEECGKVSCRLCGEESHVPLSCDEVEKDGEVVARTKLEDAMTEAMVRACVKCTKRFFKDEGCNKMKCECGQSMCYLCRKPVDDDYKHFYAQGASPVKGKCPLWSDNTNLHKAEVMKAAVEAKKVVDAKKLKFDPTKNLEKPPEGFDPKALHMAAAANGEYDEDDDDDDDDSDDEDDFIDDDDDVQDFWDYRRARRLIDGEFEEDGFLDDDEDEVGYRPYDWM